MSKLPVLVALAVGLAGCAARAPNLPPVVPEGIEKRTGHPIRPLEQRPDGTLPAGVNLSDGVTEEEAVAVALWNNAQAGRRPRGPRRGEGGPHRGRHVAQPDAADAVSRRAEAVRAGPLLPARDLLAAAEADGSGAQAVGPAGRVAGPERPRHGAGRPAGTGRARAGAGARARGARGGRPRQADRAADRREAARRRRQRTRRGPGARPRRHGGGAVAARGARHADRPRAVAIRHGAGVGAGAPRRRL